MRRLIESTFKEAVNDLFKDRYDDVRKAILNNPRKERFFDNIVEQFKKCENNPKIKLNQAKIKSIIRDLVKTYGQCVILEKEKELGEDVAKKVALEEEFYLNEDTEEETCQDGKT